MKITLACLILLALVVTLTGVGRSLPAGTSGAVAQGKTATATPAFDPEVIAMLRGFITSGEPDVRASGLEWIARDPRAQHEGFIPSIFAALKDGNERVRNQALANMGWIYERHRSDDKGREAFDAILDALKQTSDRAARLVAIDLLRGSAERGEYDEQRGRRRDEALVANPAIRSLAASLLADPESSLRPELLRVVEASRSLQAVPEIIDALREVLHDNNLTVRSNAADLLITLHQEGGPAGRERARPILLAALEENDPNVQLRISRALNIPIPRRKIQPPVLPLSGEKISTAEVPLDFNYFTAFVQPLFVKRHGGDACVDCHTPEANASGSFRVLRPGPDGRYTVEQSRINFVSTLAVVDRKSPERSKLLLKPLNPRAPEGGLRGMTHDGGVYWDNRYDPDFQLLDDWLKGTKLEVPPDKQLSYTYFVQHVEPIFAVPGPDGFACINCHSTHAIFHLQSPETREGKFSVDQLENNYEAAHRVIDEASPSNSYIVRKPTSPREGETGGLSHAGGVRWPDKKESWQYKALVTWMGMRNLAPQ